MALSDWFGLRSATQKDRTGWLVEFITGGQESDAGVSVNAETAQRCSAVFACVQVLSQDIAKLPLILYKRNKDGKTRERVLNHPLTTLTALKPNRWQTSFEYREMMQGHLALRGNAFSMIVRDNKMTPIELVPLHPDRTKIVVNDDRDVFYDVKLTATSNEIRLPAVDVMHIRERSDDGLMGMSRITQARNAIGLAVATEKHGAKLFANGARPGGILSHPGKIGAAGRDAIVNEFENRFRGSENAHKLFVAGEGMKYETVGMTQSDAQFIESRKYQRSEIASVFRVPPHKIGDLEKATFSNIEHQSLEYVIDTLLPIVRRWEQRLNLSLLREKEQADHYFEFKLEGLLRGDFQTRMSGYATARQWGWMSANDIRSLENMNPVAGGDEYLSPLNMVAVGAEAPPDPRPRAKRGKND
jgi:HK97 family phage portal protein